MTPAPVALRALNLLWKAYLNHLLWFTIGAFAGAFEAFFILAAIWKP